MKFRRFGGSTSRQSYTEIALAFSNIHVSIYINILVTGTCNVMTTYVTLFEPRQGASDINWAERPQKMVRRLKFRIWEVDGLYYLSCGNKSTDQLRSTTQPICTFVLAYAKNRVSHDAAKMIFL